MSVFINLTGKRFGSLTVLKYCKGSQGCRSRWLCRCKCGNMTKVDAPNLKNGHTKSCGCLRGEVCRRAAITHGLSKTEEYGIWHGMKNRCYNENDQKHWKNYGGRGIKICDRWRNSFEHFIADMGHRPSVKHTLERLDNNGDYSPSNCRWEIPSTNLNNKRTNIRIEFNGRIQTVTQWARELNMHQATLRYRLKRGWPVEKTLLTPCADFIEERKVLC